MSARRSLPLWTEVPLVAVSVAVVMGFIRVYEDWSFLGPLLGFALGAHLLAIVTRRRRINGAVVVLLAFVGAAVATGLLLFPGTTAFGIPTGATWDAAVESMRVARDQYPVVLAPAVVLPGFQLAAGLALWVAAWFADWTAHRLRAIAEALAATTAIFVFCAVLGSGQYQIVCAVGFAAAALWFVGVQRAMAIEREQSWLPTHRATAQAVLRSTAAIGVVAILLGTVVGPRLPGADAEASISWRNQKGGNASRVTVSPMVELRKRLVDQTNRVLFTVRSPERAYWRLTSLDHFDGEIWSSSGEFKQAGEELPTDAPLGRRGKTITQEVEIDALAAIWAPTAFEAVSVRQTNTPLRWDPDSSTLIVESSEPTSDGLTYSVQSMTPEYEKAALDRSSVEDPPEIADRYLGLPDDFPFKASDLAQSVTRSGDTRYDKAVLLQDYFRREFDYSLDTPPGHGDDALLEFLASGEGYCEQFAGAFAAMARSLGIPARVAVGFTPGNRDDKDDNLYRVRGRHAHAWPEVYFPSVGWVPFEPTPGRGMPGAEEYTGVREQQDDAQPVNTVTTTVTTTTPPAVTRPGRTIPPREQEPERTRTAGSAPSEIDDGGFSPLQVVGVTVLCVALIGGIIVLRRRRRAAHRFAGLAHADQEWEHVVHQLARKRALHLDPAETHEEFAARAAPEIGLSGPALVELASLMSEARWSPHGLDEAGEARVHELAAEVIADLHAKEPALEPVG